MNTLEKLKQSAVEYLFPLFCLGCGSEGVWVCKDCFATIGHAGAHGCPACHAPISVLQSLRAVGAYREESLLGKLIQVFKYEYAEAVLPLIGAIIRPYLINHRGGLAAIDLIVPVPLHPRRYAERGFNQAELIARIVGEVIGRPVAPALRRRRYTQVQARLHRAERQENVKAAFTLRRGAPVAGQTVLLVDDVYTTGATMQECARVLGAAGAAQVAGFTLARG